MRWIINKQITTEEKNQFPQINPIILQLLFNRGLKTQEQIDEFLYPDYSQDVHDPFLFSEMKKVTQRIFLAIENQELIMVHGDYDADGICGSLLLIETLEKLGAKTDIYIPDRAKEGNGLKEKAIDYMNQQKETQMSKLKTQNQNLNLNLNIKTKEKNKSSVENTKTQEQEIKKSKNQRGLIITVDCGIKNVEAIEYAKKNNIDVIITDHHIFDENIPKAFAIIHTKIGNAAYPFKDLAGAGVAFKLAQALLREKQKMDNEFNFEGFEKWLLDLLAIATIADMVPLLGENKTLTKYGLIVLNKTKRIGLKKLIEVAGLLPTNLNVFNVGFQIAPRINATGRLTHANTSYQLLKSQNEKEAQEIAEELNKINQERQKLLDEMTAQALKQIGEITNEQKILFVLHKNWPEGIVGLLAGKLCKNFNRPAIAMTFKEQKINNKKIITIKGSGRSNNNFNLILALEKIKNILLNFGGHKCACAFNFLENDLENFKEKLSKIARQEILDQDLISTLDIDQEVNLSEINWELFDELKKFEPYGKENAKPKFLVKNLKITNLEKVGQTKQHLKLFAADNQRTVKMIGFCFGEKGNELNVNDKIDVVFEIDVNEWNGNRELQLKIIDLEKA